MHVLVKEPGIQVVGLRVQALSVPLQYILPIGLKIIYIRYYIIVYK